MLPAKSEDIEGNEAAQLLKDPAELRRRVSELREENVILAKRAQEALRDSARLAADYRERQWEFLSRREPQLCAALAPDADLGAHLLLHMQASGRLLADQIKEVTERAQQMEEEAACNHVEMETARDEADAFQEDVRWYGVQAAAHHRRLRDASAALQALRRHKHLLCERLRAADWALDLVLHDAPTRLLAADMLDAGPDGAVRIRHMQEHVAKLESQLRPVDLSVASMSESRHSPAGEASRRAAAAAAAAERELRVLDYEERDRRPQTPQPQQSPGAASDASSRGGDSGGEPRAAGGRGQRRRPRSAGSPERRQRLAEEVAGQRQRAARAARGLAVLREEAEDLAVAIDKMRKAVRKMRGHDAQLQEEVEQSGRLVARAEEQQEARLRLLRRYTRARQHVSASFEIALRSSQRRRTTLQSALRHSQLHLRVLHHIMQHLLPMDGEELPAHFYRGLVDASEKERDVLMDRMATLAQKLCRAKSRAHSDWQRLHLVRCRIQALEGRLRPYVVDVGADDHSRKQKPLSEWSAIRERQLEKELQELQEASQKWHEGALKVENRYLQEMWALHHLFQLAVSRLESQYGRPGSCASLLSEAKDAQQRLSRVEAEAAMEEVAAEHQARPEQSQVTAARREEVAEKLGQEVAGRSREEVAEKAAEEVAASRKKAERRESQAMHAKPRTPRRKRQKKEGKKRKELTALRAAQVSETCHQLMPACICPHMCSQEPDAPCTVLRKLAFTGRRQRTSLTNNK